MQIVNSYLSEIFILSRARHQFEFHFGNPFFFFFYAEKTKLQCITQLTFP